MEKLKIEIDERVENIIKTIDKELKGEMEFNGYLVANKTNVWRIIDLIIPNQKVSGGSVDEKKGEKLSSQYEEKFLEFFKGKDGKVIVGTMHSHNSMGSFQSGADTKDVDNHAYLNLNAGLPFIDIVWSHEDCKVWVVLKINNGMGKRVFQTDDTCLEIVETNDVRDIMSLIKKKGYEIDEEGFKKSITKKVDVNPFIKNIEKNIEKRTYGMYDYSNWWKSDRKNVEEIVFESDLEPKMRIEHWKKKQLLMVKVWGDPQYWFFQELESWVEENGIELETKLMMTEMGKKFWQIGLLCNDKDTFRKIREDLVGIFEQFKLLKEDYNENEIDGGKYIG